MGITFSNACLMAKAKCDGACFDDVLTIGRQSLYIAPAQLRRLNREYGTDMDISAVMKEKYADEFFKRFLGVKNLCTLDYSDYQGSSIIHDMNEPVDTRYDGAFDAVIDSGSLEHIYNFPVAVSNCMRMVKDGGNLFIFNMANNHMGHGFYQFSPELFFRIFCDENGFEVRDIILEKHHFPGPELSSATKCYSVADPALVRERVGLVTSAPVAIMVHAVKTVSRPVFTSYPTQSDYTSVYLANETGSCKGTGCCFIGKLLKKIYAVLPLRLKNFITGRLQLYRYSFSNRRFYRRWNPFD